MVAAVASVVVAAAVAANVGPVTGRSAAHEYAVGVRPVSGVVEGLGVPGYSFSVH